MGIAVEGTAYTGLIMAGIAVWRLFRTLLPAQHGQHAAHHKMMLQSTATKTTLKLMTAAICPRRGLV